MHHIRSRLMRSMRSSHSIVISTGRARRTWTGAVIMLGAVLGCGGGNDGTTGAGGTGACAVACTTGRNCCGGGCVNLQNDPFNCGVCGRRCEGGTPFCGDGTCQQTPCDSQIWAPNS